MRQYLHNILQRVQSVADSDGTSNAEVKSSNGRSNNHIMKLSVQLGPSDPLRSAFTSSKSPSSWECLVSRASWSILSCLLLLFVPILCQQVWFQFYTLSCNRRRTTMLPTREASRHILNVTILLKTFWGRKGGYKFCGGYHISSVGQNVITSDRLQKEHFIWLCI